MDSARDTKPCRHRFYRAYDDGLGYWDYLCLECGHWPERDELDPLAVAESDLDEGEDWRSVYAENAVRGER